MPSRKTTVLRPSDQDLGWSHFYVVFRKGDVHLHMLSPNSIPDLDLALVITVLQREARRRLGSLSPDGG